MGLGRDDRLGFLRTREKPGEQDVEREAGTEALRDELLERFMRAADAARENQERAQLAAERANQAAPNPSPAQFSGNFVPSISSAIRIGGKLVEG
ncbi:MAG TPA: hypothetical protein VHY79_15180 [Rhizomicrobium sp.]|jgi:hypothetical protein|nr:hypothetical protein [Rhizomicrobium sp.]